MVHIKNILADCDSDIEVAKEAIRIYGDLLDPSKRREVAIWMAKQLINSSKK